MKSSYIETTTYGQAALEKQLTRDSKLMVRRKALVLSRLHVGDETTFLEGFQTSAGITRRSGEVIYIHPNGRYIGIRLYNQKTGEPEPCMTCVFPFEIELKAQAVKLKDPHGAAA